MYYTYMLRCMDNSIYTGITVDIDRRMREHFNQSEKCAKYTRTHTPQKLEAVWQSENRVLASRLEFNIKRLSKAEKESLIKYNNLEILEDKIKVKNYKRIKNLQKL